MKEGFVQVSRYFISEIVTPVFWRAAFIFRQRDDKKETQSLIFSLLIGINFQPACGNNGACAHFEPEEDSFIKIGQAMG